MKHILLFLFLIVTAVTACNNHGLTYKKLEKADSLFMNDKDSAALDILTSISNDELETEEERAYYDLLLTSTRYRLRLITDKDTLNKACIEYYRRTDDKEKLARALYYKGMAIYKFGDVDTTIRMLKEAEKLAKKTENTAILNYIYINLSGINNHVGNANTSLKYAKMSLQTARQRKDYAITCISLTKISESFSCLNNHDSALFYIEKAIPYVKYLRKYEQADLLADISASYFNLEQFDKAEQYIRQAIAVEPTDYCYYILGSVYLETGRTAEAEVLWKKVISTAHPELKAETMLWLADLKQAEGNDREAAELLTRAEAMKDSMERSKKAENTLRLQNEAERTDDRQRSKTRLTIVAAAAAGVAAVLTWIAVYHNRRENLTRKRLESIEQQEKKEKQEIAGLKASEHENTKKINALSRRLEALRERHAAIIGLGRKHCEEITAGGTVATWKKNDFEAAIEYCRTVMPETVSGIESRYGRLTPYKTFFLLLTHIGVADDAIPHAMNMTAGAARTMKYRLKKLSSEAS